MKAGKPKVVDFANYYFESQEDRHGRNFIILGCMLFITLSVFIYFIEKLDSVAVQVVIFLIVLFAEIAWVWFDHNVMKKKMIKK